MRDQAGKNGESQEAKAEGRTGEATVRRKREEWKGRSRGLSSRKGSGRDRKGTKAERKMLEARAEGEHLRNGRGSESGKGERKQTAKPSTGTWKDGMRNQAGEKGETEEAKAESGHRESGCKAEPGRNGKENRKAE